MHPQRTRALNVGADRRLLEKLRDAAGAFDVAASPGVNVYECCGRGVAGLVQCWAIPGDRPKCWDAPLPPGAWGPSALVGEIDWEEDPARPGTYSLLVRTYARDLIEQRVAYLRKRAQMDARRTLKPAARVREEDALSEDDFRSLLDWLEGKARALLRLADVARARVGTRCPFCKDDWILYRGELLNRLVDHIAEAHPGVAVTGLVLGEPTVLQTTAGEVTLEAALEPVEKAVAPTGGPNHG